MPSSQQDPHTPLHLRSPRAELIYLTLTKGILCARPHTEQGYRGLDMVYKKQNQSLWQNLFSTVPRLRKLCYRSVCVQEGVGSDAHGDPTGPLHGFMHTSTYWAKDFSLTECQQSLNHLCSHFPVVGICGGIGIISVSKQCMCPTQSSQSSGLD